MDSEKRKRNSESSIEGGRRWKAWREEHEDAAATTSCTATDAEVEEFFAILRRLHSAVNYFQKDNGKVTEKGVSTKHGFKWRDLEQTNGAVKAREKIESEVDVDVVEENNILLDLNAYPSYPS